MPCSSQCTSVADRPIRIPPVPHDGAAARSAFHQSRMTVPPPCCDSHFHIVDPANKFPCAAERRWQQGRCIVNRWLTAGLLLASVFPAAAADQIKLVVPFAAGGPVDLIARTIAGGLPAKLGADVIIENRGGAGGVIGTELDAKAAPHGPTLLQASHRSHVLSAPLRAQLPYRPIKSFTPIVFVGVVPSLLVVSAQAKIDSLPGLLPAANPNALTYVSPAPAPTLNTAPHLFRP